MDSPHPTLLVVDDEPLNLELVVGFLKGTGYEIITAGDAEDAQRLLDEAPTRFDALLLDHMLPGISGMGLLALLKADPRHRLLPVIMQTAAAAPEQIARGLELGAYYYLTKPFTPRTLRAVVRAALESRGQVRTMAAQIRLYTDGIPLLMSAKFQFRTLAEARNLAIILAGFCPQPVAAAMGLTELLVNAVEHGNLDIDYDAKSRLRAEDRWEEEIERRLTLPEYAGRVAEVEFTRSPGALRFAIKDAGRGFDYQRYLDHAPERAFDLHGRGIALARQLSFTELAYQDGGSKVVATIATTLQ